MPSDYDVRPKGSLKLKGTVPDGGIVKKKKKSNSKAKKQATSIEERVNDLEQELEQAVQEDEVKEASPSGSGHNSPAVASNSTTSSRSDRETAAEKRFREVQKERLAKKVAKLANKTHKDRVHDFNSKLEALSEHHDIPKVGPG